MKMKMRKRVMKKKKKRSDSLLAINCNIFFINHFANCPNTVFTNLIGLSKFISNLSYLLGCIFKKCIYMLGIFYFIKFTSYMYYMLIEYSKYNYSNKAISSHHNDEHIFEGSLKNFKVFITTCMECIEEVHKYVFQ